MAESAVKASREALGPVGVCLPVSFTDPLSIDQQWVAVGRLERAGHRVVWTNEVIGKDAFVQLAMLLGATERMVFGTCIANVWARSPQTMHAAAAQLAQAYPGRFVLGVGIGYPEQADSAGREFGRPVETMRGYLNGMDAPTSPPAPDAAYARIVAANGPKMLALAGQRADGALPAGLPAEYTTRARRLLGPDKLLVIGLSVAGDRRAAREAVSAMLAGPAAQRLRGLGYSASDIDEVSDRLVKGFVAYGDPVEVAATVSSHLAAGADHVTLLPPVGGDFGSGIDRLEALAPALAELWNAARR